MRLLHSRTTEAPRAGARQDLQRQRFKAYFPRLFAYACAATGDDEAARDVVVTSFSEVFSMPDMREAEFEMALFRGVHELSHSGEYRVRRHNDGLTPRERDVISLLFDAQLDRLQISQLLSIREDAVATTVVRGLRKLRTRLEPATAGSAVPSFS